MKHFENLICLNFVYDACSECVLCVIIYEPILFGKNDEVETLSII